MIPSSFTIAEAADKLRKKEISSVELVQSCIETIEKRDKVVNAVVHRNFDRALEEAKKFDSKNSTDHPLAGIPLIIVVFLLNFFKFFYEIISHIKCITTMNN